ncbi:hypothetical protein ARALYDRAFT_472227 [Arabidopsis lyrata subsp. lyrata]|uniref:Uncharacterized protein n=1 Tax=Arabidopsis lyrata subsp. lyrata TaxID=81972 RepID=D7KI85_ARALL|nr:hypothetical protein ARALYDRAFT_472227 [Arabidopsis lyrata subsp. lyrata]
MQAKINSFFIFYLFPTVWENNRNAIVNTYERRSAIPDRSQVLKGCIGKPLKKGSSSVPKNLKKKRNYTQFHLELGQSDFLLRHCAQCGAKYAPGDELDEKNHQSFHKDYMYGIPFKGWQNENRIIMVSENDSPAHRNKVVKMMEVELGEDWILHQHCKYFDVYYVEPIGLSIHIHSEDLRMSCRASNDRLDYGAIVCEEEAKPAVCGIRAIWASPSNRRKGIATWLLDTTRESFCNNGCMLEKSQLAFSQPSTMGRSFGSNYFGTCSFLVYKSQLIDTHFS